MDDSLGLLSLIKFHLDSMKSSCFGCHSFQASSISKHLSLKQAVENNNNEDSELYIDGKPLIFNYLSELDEDKVELKNKEDSDNLITLNNTNLIEEE